MEHGQHLRTNDSSAASSVLNNVFGVSTTIDDGAIVAAVYAIG
jgi:hypothetical protein